MPFQIFSVTTSKFVGQFIVYKLMWICTCKSKVDTLGLKTELWNFVTELSSTVMCIGLLYLERKTNNLLSYEALKAEWK